MSHYSINQFNQAVSIVRRAEDDIRAVTGMTVALQMVALDTIRVTPEAITRIAASAGQITYEQITSKDRHSEILWPRYVAIRATKHYMPTISHATIARIYGLDRTSILTALQTSETLMESNELFQRLYHDTIKAVEAWLREPSK